MLTNATYIPYNLNIPGTATKHQSWPRVVLNYKGIPHKTEWVEFPDIASVAKRIHQA
ncbi:hypothetical protein BC827DRAFT_1239846 [Russula dissimulans]|nr:hypothetical protein BC827DRAFT_1239846 [Russula dissimulans]